MKSIQRIPRALSCLLLLFSIAAALRAQQAPTEQSQKLLDLTNQARSAQGLQPLQWDPALAAAAQAHAQKMVDQHTLSHQLPGEPDLPARAGQAGAHFHAIAENVAMGGTPDDLQKEWMKSPPHRANILDPRLDHVGIGAVEKSGYWYAAVVFSTAVENVQPAGAEQKIGDLLRKQGIDPSHSSDDARKDCAQEDGDASGSRPLFVMRWEGSSLDQLPDQLQQRLKTGKYKTASVASCNDGNNASPTFTTYRMVVLLY